MSLRKKKKLVIYYYPVRAYEEVDWEFDQKMYMGYSIKDLSFHGQTGVNTLKIL